MFCNGLLWSSKALNRLGVENSAHDSPLEIGYHVLGPCCCKTRGISRKCTLPWWFIALGNVSAMKHVPFSSASSLTFAKAKIKAGPLTVISNKIPELKSLGLKEGVGSNRLTVNHTRDLISLIRAHVSFSVSIHILISLFMPTITFRRRQDVAYWSTRSYCMSYRI